MRCNSNQLDLLEIIVRCNSKQLHNRLLDWIRIIFSHSNNLKVMIRAYPKEMLVMPPRLSSLMLVTIWLLKFNDLRIKPK